MLNPRSSTLDPRRALLAAAFLVCACGTLLERPLSGIAEFCGSDRGGVADAAASVYDTPGKRAAMLQRVWQLIADRYYDPLCNGVDWREVRQRYLPAALAAASDRSVTLRSRRWCASCATRTRSC